MPDIFVIGDTIRFTAGIKNMADEYYDPDTITVEVIGSDGKVLLEADTPERTGKGLYHYDWEIEGVTDKYNLIIIWRWVTDDVVNIKRLKMKAIPETDW